MIPSSSNCEPPPMLALCAVDLMRTAIERPPGIKVVTSGRQSALKLRRQLYGARRRARVRCDNSMDCLSIIVKGREVRLVLRAERLGVPVEGVERVLPLRPDEIPAIIGSRGPQSLGLRGALAILDLLAESGSPSTICQHSFAFDHVREGRGHA